MNVINKPKTSDITTGPLPASRKIYLDGQIHPDIRVPMREIALHETAAEPNVVVYDTSGPYTDPAETIDIEAGLSRLREHVDFIGRQLADLYLEFLEKFAFEL